MRSLLGDMSEKLALSRSVGKYLHFLNNILSSRFSVKRSKKFPIGRIDLLWVAANIPGKCFRLLDIDPFGCSERLRDGLQVADKYHQGVNVTAQTGDALVEERYGHRRATVPVHLLFQ